MAHMPTTPSAEIVRLADSTRRLVRTVDGLDEPALAGASLLPDWSRAHVVAHLALNAEAMARGLEGARTGRAEPLYDSPRARADDVEELAHAGPSELRERFLGSAAVLADLLEAMPVTTLATEVEWYPGGMRRQVATFADIRRGEVEVHHVDLATPGYDHTAWPGDFAAWVVATRAAALDADPPFTVYAGDLDRAWSVGGGAEGDPVVTGPAHTLAWWLSGRGSGEGLACDGPLPRIGAW
ncbi:maleylpyruvate isomerase family mycothiol-dependent enzyme [Nocardioides lentus]|uniref:Maleylpyruvate isomerase family mycothiol-dependent enzyme n=2 Tax=Nocardioides lentus TaxID=338077 RepID=A0ABN2P1W7_9ACTN